MIAHVFFDLDGTLVDSYPGIAYSAGVAVAHVFPNRRPPNFLPFIGPPVREIFRQALRENDSAVLLRLESAFRTSYDSEGWRQTNAYPGVEKVLRALNERGIICHVLTNKPKLPTQAILAHLSLNVFFSDLITPDSRVPRYSSKMEAALEARHRHALVEFDGIVVGDSADDGAAAEACGFEFVAVTFGYGVAHRQNDPTVHFRLQRFEDLLDIIDRPHPSSTSAATSTGRKTLRQRVQ